MYGRISSRMMSYQNCNAIINDTEELGGLWLGDYTAALDKQLLAQKNIKTVLTVAAGLPVSYPPESQCGIHHKTYLALDIESYKISKHFADTYFQIEQNRKRGGVLIHCAAGVSRSASVVIAYLMKKNKMSYQAAHKLVKQKRPVICPNYGFVRELRNFESQLNQQQSRQNEEKPLYLQQEQKEEEEKMEKQDIKQKKDDRNEMIQSLAIKGQQQQLKMSESQQKRSGYQGNLKQYYSQSVKKQERIRINEPHIVTYNSQNKLINQKGQKLPTIKQNRLY